MGMCVITQPSIADSGTNGQGEITSDSIVLNITTYTKTNDFELSDDNYDYSEWEDTEPNKLQNGIYKTTGQIDDYEKYIGFLFPKKKTFKEGEECTFEFENFETTRARVVNVDGKLVANIILKEKNLIKKEYSVKYSGENLSISNPKSITLPCNLDGVRKNLMVTAGSNPVLSINQTVDDNGNTVNKKLDLAPSIGEKVTLEQGKDPYSIVSAEVHGDEINIKLEKTRKENLNIHAVVNTLSDKFDLKNGPLSVEIGKASYKATPENIKRNGNTITFDLKIKDVVLGSKEKLDELSPAVETSLLESTLSKWQFYYSMGIQKYDNDSKTLTMNMGRKIYFNISDIKEDVNYNEFAVKHLVDGFTLTLYDENDNKIMDSVRAYNVSAYANQNLLSGVSPGTYYLKITKAPGGYQDYDLSYKYKLTVDETGLPKLEIYTSKGYQLSNPYGQENGVATAGHYIYQGVKTPFLILIGKNYQPEKSIENSTIENSKTQTMVEKDDEVEFKIDKKISKDHNVALNFQKYVDIGTKTDQGFSDQLDKRLEYVEGSLKVLLDGNPTEEFKATYDKGNHEVIVKDNTSVNIVNFDFNTPIKLGKDKQLSVKFKVKVKSDEKSIFNTVGNTVELIPYVNLVVNKKWEGGSNLLSNFDKVEAEKFIDNFTVEGYEGNKLIINKPAKEFLKKDSLKVNKPNFSFKLVKLPKYTDEQLKKPLEERTAIEYKIKENLPEEYRKFVSSVTIKGNVFTFVNKYPPEKPPVPPEEPPEEPPTPPEKPPVPPREAPKTGDDIDTIFYAFGLGLSGALLAGINRRKLKNFI